MSDFIIELSDEVGTPISELARDEMIKKIRSIINEYGFDIDSYGDTISYRKSNISMTMDLLKEMLIDKIDKL